MERRSFLGACAASCAAAAFGPASANELKPRRYDRALLVDASGAPLRASALVPHRNYVFHYPYAATPCFLIDLGQAAGPAPNLKTAGADDYAWPGGVGPGRSIVAYSAICAHKLTYPTRDISFISYREQATPHSRLARVIHCCSEHSQYDPAQGARVLAGPATQPLAAILLEYEPARDQLAAVGTLGGEMFDEFFTKFGFRLAMEHGGKGGRQKVGERSAVAELADFCRQQVRC